MTTIKNKYHKNLAEYFETRWKEPYLRALDEIPYQFAKGEQYSKLQRILTNFLFLQYKIKYFGPFLLQQDLDFVVFQKNKADFVSFAVLKDIIRLSSFILHNDFRQFPSQPLGRMPINPPPLLIRLQKEALEYSGNLWLNPITRCLISPGGPLRTLLKSPSGKFIKDVDLTDDGNMAVSVHSDGTLIVWDTILGTQLQRILLTRDVDEVKLIKSGEAVIYRSRDKFYLLNLETGRSKYLLTKKNDPFLNHSEISSNGHHLVYIQDKKTLIYANLLNGKKTKYELKKNIRAFTLTNDGQNVILVFDSDKIHFFDISTEKLEVSPFIQIPKTEFYALTPNCKEYISIDRDGKLKRKDINTNKVLMIYDGLLDGVRSIICGWGDKVIADVGKKLQVWHRLSGNYLGSPLKSRAQQMQLPFDTTSQIDIISQKTIAYYRSTSLPTEEKRFWTCSNDGIIRLWDLNQGHYMKYEKIDLHSKVLVTADSRNKLIMQVEIIICELSPHSFYFHIKVWDFSSKQLQRDINFQCIGLEPLSADLNASVKKSRIVFTLRSKEIYVLDLDPEFSIRLLKGHTRAHPKITMAAGGSVAVSHSEDKTLMVWDLDRSPNNDIESIKIHTEKAISINQNGSRLLVSDENHNLQYWNLSSLQRLNLLKGHKATVNDLDISPNGKIAVSGSKDETVIIWNLSSGTSIFTLEGHQESVLTVMFVAQGKKIVSIAKNNSVRVWNTSTGECLLRLNYPEMKDLYYGGWRISTNGEKIVRDTEFHGDCQLSVSSLITGTELFTLENYFCNELQSFGLGESFYWTGAYALSQDGSLIAYTPQTGDPKINLIEVWNMGQANKIDNFKGHNECLRDMIFTPDNNYLITASSDCTVRVWDLSKKSEVFRMEGHTDDVKILAVTKDGKKVVSCSRDRTLRLWDLKTGYCLAVFTAETPLQRVILSANGNTIVALSSQGIVHCLKLIGLLN